MIRLRVFADRRGFTFVELLVVVAILGLAAAVSVPFFAKVSRRQSLLSAAREIQQSLLAARMRAVKANQNTSFVITAATGTESLHELDTVAPDNSPTPTPTPIGRTYLARNAVDFVTLPANNKVTFAGDGHIIAPPPPTPAVIVLQGPVGSTITNQVTIQATSSGRVKVITPVAWQ